MINRGEGCRQGVSWVVSTGCLSSLLKYAIFGPSWWPLAVYRPNTPYFAPILGRYWPGAAG